MTRFAARAAANSRAFDDLTAELSADEYAVFSAHLHGALAAHVPVTVYLAAAERARASATRGRERAS
ncbi:hypothetical protein K8W59_09015 [Nocardioides rotundus]|uniref:hypothetical protein n=1 Tax=Nocardioides rotundus TaxID=1774216 RepID=UPI001CC11654|nr:hypothetical protein [Nocardioides rotundus]UAL31553.1 hypothetical protein K8W59_09015 [Nocardioides rotundus]